MGVPKAAAADALRARCSATGVCLQALEPGRQLSLLRETVERPRAGASVEEARAHVLSSSQSKAVLVQKQNAHIRGTKQWDRRVIDQGGKETQGELAVSIGELQEIVDRLHGTGLFRVTGASPPQIKETLTIKGAIMGKWKDEGEDGDPTDSITLHYSKKGVHAVPSRPSWRKK